MYYFICGCIILLGISAVPKFRSTESEQMQQTDWSLLPIHIEALPQTTKVHCIWFYRIINSFNIIFNFYFQNQLRFLSTSYWFIIESSIRWMSGKYPYYNIRLQRVVNNSFLTRQLLTHVNVSWCQGITENGVEAVARGCPRLKSFISKGKLSTTSMYRSFFYLMFSFSGCRHVNDRAVTCLATYCPNLEVLYVQGCDLSLYTYLKLSFVLIIFCVLYRV